MREAFWRVKDGPNRWAATLRWLCFSETTVLLAATEANRVLRQLSLGGQAAMQAGLKFAFEVVCLCYDDGVIDPFQLMISQHKHAPLTVPLPTLLVHLLLELLPACC